MKVIACGCIPALLTCLWTAVPGRSQEAPDSSQWIANFTGDASKYVLRRQQRVIEPIAALMYVYPGDVIDLKDDSSWIAVHIGHQSDIVICKSERAGRPCDQRPPYTILEAPEDPTIPRQMLSWLSKRISDWIYGVHRVVPMQTRPVREGEISMPLLTGQTKRIVEGTRRLCLSWSGGMEPYRLRIFRHEIPTMTRTRVLDANPTKGARWCSNEIPLMQGEYSLELTGGEAHFPASFFLVVGPQEAPQLPAGSLRNLSPELQHTLEAAWVSSQGDGRWMWEAYLRIAPLCDTYRPAHELCTAVEAGRVPEDPPELTKK